ncbi:hypothetical protein ACWDOP_16145 [Nocardia sp. NPDC003693]
MDRRVEYGLREFAEAYVLARADWSDSIGGYQQDSTAYNKALRAHRERLLETLEELYELKLEMKEMVEIPRGTVLFMHFRATVNSALALRTPGNLEAGLLLRSLEAAGEPGLRIKATSKRLDQLLDSSREAHLDMLEDLLRILLGNRAHLTFTADEVAAAGGGGAAPDPTDYPHD